MGKGTLYRWLVSALGLLLVSYLFEGIQVDGLGWALLAAAILGVFNAIIRPLLILLTLPLTIFTLGFFVLVINGLMLWLTAGILPGFHVQGFWSAVGGALVLSLISLLANSLVGERGRVEVIEMRRGSGGSWQA